MNNAAIDRGGEVTKVTIPAEWKQVVPCPVSEITVMFLNSFECVMPINAMKGDDLPVSAFLKP
jgi:pyruvate-ferredoxin/flavodoxin oxidoreductase